jgi:cell division protein FtsL
MTRLNIVLLIAVIASALYLVRTQYESRRLFVEVEKAQNLARKLELEHERLEVEKRGQATPLRVEMLAKKELGMRTATPAVTQYVRSPMGAASASSGSANGSKPTPSIPSAVSGTSSAGGRP